MYKNMILNTIRAAATFNDFYLSFNIHFHTSALIRLSSSTPLAMEVPQVTYFFMNHLMSPPIISIKQATCLPAKPLSLASPMARIL